ncbi:hypothetical protein [Thomasclavelia saccharogumia]|nr:hypothetical protein [Thomasclavelia saccharogumia]
MEIIEALLQEVEVDNFVKNRIKNEIIVMMSMIITIIILFQV